MEIKNSAKEFEYIDKRYIDIKIVLANEFSAINIILSMKTESVIIRE